MINRNKKEKREKVHETDILNAELDILTSLYLDIDENKNINTFLDTLLENLRNIVSFDGANVAFIDKHDIMTIHKINHEKISPKSKLSHEYLEKVYAEKINYKEGKILACSCARENRELYFPDINPEDFEPEVKERIVNYGITSLYYLPIRSKSKILGVMRFHNYGGTMHLTEFEKNIIRRRVDVIARAMENFLLYDELKQKSMIIEKDLELARRLQQNMIPSESPSMAGVEMAMKYLPMQEVGGDFFDFLYPIKGEKNCVGILMTDASGHGVPAAFVSTMLKMAFQSKEVKEYCMHPKKIMEILNSNIIGKISDHFVTAAYCLVNLEERKLKVSSAGHNDLILVDKNSGTLKKIKPRGKPLGILKDIKFEEEEITLEPGQRIIVYTDGLTEAVDSRKVEFEKQFSDLCISERLCTPAAFAETVEASLVKHVGGRREYLEDDVALVVIDICI